MILEKNTVRALTVALFSTLAHQTLANSKPLQIENSISMQNIIVQGVDYRKIICNEISVVKRDDKALRMMRAQKCYQNNR